ncbi:MAG: hypothetical protein C5B56_08115 [Proteobacteria bacterium]|nr:MAG: hypothetical protein C5B56_08115 [Pseudomonadota bacterium]
MRDDATPVIDNVCNAAVADLCRTYDALLFLEIDIGDVHSGVGPRRRAGGRTIRTSLSKAQAMFKQASARNGDR